MILLKLFLEANKLTLTGLLIDALALAPDIRNNLIALALNQHCYSYISHMTEVGLMLCQCIH